MLQIGFCEDSKRVVNVAICGDDDVVNARDRVRVLVLLCVFWQAVVLVLVAKARRVDVRVNSNLRCEC